MSGSRVAGVVLGVCVALGATACGEGSDEPAATVTVTETVSVTPSPTPSETVTETPEPSPTEATTSATETATPAPEDGAPATYADAMARFDATGQEPAPIRRFETPGGAVFCLLGDKALAPGCELTEGIRDDKVCAGAPSPLVGRVELRGGRARPVCNTDSIRSDMPETLEHGSVSRFGDVQCLSEEIGVTCVDLAAKAGFFIGTGRYTTFRG